MGNLLYFWGGVFGKSVKEEVSSKLLKVRNVDYSKYLGPGYTTPKDFNTLISNHQSYYEIFYFGINYLPAFVSK